MPGLDENVAELRAERLISLVEAHLPLETNVRGPADAWQLDGPALLSLQAGTLRALGALRALDQEADAFVLLRTLYEHAVTFAWLAAEPGEDRHQRFLKSDAEARLAMDDDGRKVGVELLDEAQRREFESQVATLSKAMPDLRQRAEAADEHWVDRIPGLRKDSEAASYRGLYAIAYRRHSAIAHPSLMGLNFVTVDLPGGGKRVQLEQRDPEMHGPFGLGSILLGFSLLIAGHALGWPEASAVEAAFEEPERTGKAD